MKISRRGFMKSTAAAGAVAIHPSLALGERRDPLRFVQIGCGGKGESDRAETLSAGAKLVAVCDVDEGNPAVKKVYQTHADLPK